jgi:hypothetical protein
MIASQTICVDNKFVSKNSYLNYALKFQIVDYIVSALK